MTWTLTRLRADDAFPPIDRALPADAPYPGLLAIGGDVNAESLCRAYARGIFPWYEPGEPPLWWSPDPRMVLEPASLRVTRSLRQSVRRMMADPRYALRMDADFAGTMRDCAAPRNGAKGTWIGPSILRAYALLHARGLAHSMELWRDAQRVAGLYFVSMGGMVFGESMFTRVADGSKTALLALCGFCLANGLGPIDCQQETPHLASMGARPRPRAQFEVDLREALTRPAPTSWRYDWNQMQRDCANWL